MLVAVHMIEIMRGKNMSKLAWSMTAAVLIAGLSGCNNAKSPDAVQDNVSSAQAKASSEVADARQDAGKDINSAQTKMNEQGTELNNADAKGSYDVAMAKADGNHKVSSAKCDALAGDAQKSCKDQADANYDLAKANAKATLDAQKR
jgi:vacuolar-type H+-ATPase subunit H